MYFYWNILEVFVLYCICTVLFLYSNIPEVVNCTLAAQAVYNVDLKYGLMSNGVCTASEVPSSRGLFIMSYKTHNDLQCTVLSLPK